MKRVLCILLFLLCIIFSGCDSMMMFNQPAKKLARGTVEGNVYKSEYAQLSFSPPEGWEYASDEEVAEIMGLTSDMLADSDLKLNQEMLKKRTIYDVMVQNTATGSNVIVMYENLALVVGGTKFTEEQYYESVKSQLDTAQVYRCVYSDITEESLCGNQYKSLCVEIPDYNAFQYFYIRKVDKYMLCVIISVFGDDDISSILNCFD